MLIEGAKIIVFDFLWTDGENKVRNAVWDKFRSETRSTEMFPVPDRDFPATDLYYISDADKIKWVDQHIDALSVLLRWWIDPTFFLVKEQ